ncbi:MAG: S8 family serine peptidase [Thermoplasmatota archaeon]
MKTPYIISIAVLGVLVASGLFTLNSEGDLLPDDTPFGFDNDYWYDMGDRVSHTQIDISVEQAVSQVGADAGIEVLIQFYPPLTGSDILAAEEAGLEVLHQMNALPAIFARGNLRSIEEIARYPRTFWIENNTIMDLFMEKTTSTINASKVWDTPIIDSVSIEHPAIDGTGVTAVVLDSGIDAGHPDLDYGEKTVKNYKSDSDFVWREVENADTSSGHGTHCAGTVAGNGDASGGARAGVAKDAKLIGLSTGEAVSIFNAVGGMEWVYEHSRPGHTYEWDDPIRVVSNSWGPSPGDYNPEDSISIISQKITFENNVVVVFAASNSGGDGTEIETNPYGNVPSNIAVAAFARDGSGVASFSSRGQLGIETTYPDVGAPGVGIWSTAARRTFISMSTKTGGDLSEIDPYYFAISGTSMATPHIAGVVALLFEAYPKLGMSHIYEDADEEKLANNWTGDERNLVHEVELILEASAKYVQPSDGEEPLASNYIPHVNSTGWNDAPFDFAQGYGIVQVDRAVGIALALKELRERDFDRDGSPDHPNACIRDAIAQYEGTMKMEQVTYETNSVYAAWNGEWSRFANQTSQPIPVNHDTSKLVYIPEGADTLTLDFSYDPWDTDGNRIASLYANIDWDGDGRADWTQSGEFFTDHRTSDVPVGGNSGRYWSVNVEGVGIDWSLGDRFRESQFKEVRTEFTVSVNLSFSQGEFDIPEQDPHAGVATWKPLETGSSGTFINMTRYIYDLREIHSLTEEEPAGGGGGGFNWWIILAVIAVIGAAVLGYMYYDKNKKYKEAIIKEENVEAP